MIHNKPILIGFDARNADSDFQTHWDRNRIETYLLKSEIVKPLSTDLQVWGTVFDFYKIELPQWTGPRQQLWDDLSRLEHRIASQNIAQPYWVIGVSEYVAETEYDKLKQLYKIRPPIVSSDWALLGYDVSDHYLLSGLMNAGYSAIERDKLNEEWSEHLNEWHLFTEIDAADEFRELSNIRVQEHSPFSVYGIYKIRESSRL